MNRFLKELGQLCWFLAKVNYLSEYWICFAIHPIWKMVRIKFVWVKGFLSLFDVIFQEKNFNIAEIVQNLSNVYLLGITCRYDLVEACKWLA